MKLFLIVLLSLAIAGCKPEDTSPASAFELPKASLRIGGHTLQVEVANTQQTMSIGLMYRQKMPEESGMIFVFPELRKASFWMHETTLPLDIAFLDRDGRIREIHPAKPLDETPIVSGSADIAYALETNLGWFLRHGVKAGTVVEDLPKFPSR